MPASSQTSPTSVTRLTGSSQAAQRIGTRSIQGRRSSSSCSSPPSARSASSSFDPITVRWPHAQG